MSEKSNKLLVTLEIDQKTGRLLRVLGNSKGLSETGLTEISPREGRGGDWKMNDILISLRGCGADQGGQALGCPQGWCPVVINGTTYCVPCGG